MSSCCTTPPSTDGTNKFFSRWSKSYAKQFRKKGLAKEQRLLLEGVRQESVAAKNILDIGCGVGSLHLTLLKEGAEHAVGVDLAEGMIEKAKNFAAEMGILNRANYLVGDFVQISDSIPEADITMLDKVVCCYENLELLLEKSTGRTRRLFALSHPKENALVELMFKAHIAFTRLFRMKFHPFWHNWENMREQIAKSGFRLAYANSTFVWQVLVYKRS